MFGRLSQGIYRWSERIAPTSWAFMVEVGLVILTGALASVFSAELGRFALPSDRATAWKLGGFWASFVVTVVFAGIRHTGLFRLNQRLTQEMMDAVRTQPQAAVLARYNDFFKESFNRYRRQLELCEPSQDAGQKLELEQLIRDLLADICKLAQMSNPHHSSKKYAANIMLYIPLDKEMSDAERGSIKREIKFTAAYQGIDGLRGVLRLMRNLSCDNETDENAPKRSLRPLCLPIPMDVRKPSGAGGGFHWFVLPGAPRSYVSFSPSQVPDVRMLGEWCRENASFDPELIERIEQYMEEAVSKRRFGSFYSLPLASPDWQHSRGPTEMERAIDEPDLRPMGVINIESVDAGLFELPEPAKDFFIFIGPFLLLLTELVAMLISGEPNYAKLDLGLVDDDNKY